MHSPVETIEINDNTRLIVYYDDEYIWDGDSLSEEEIANLPDPVGVVLERRHEWTRLNLNGETDGMTRHEWEEEESVWGCYLDETYTAQVVAKECWGVTL